MEIFNNISTLIIGLMGCGGFTVLLGYIFHAKAEKRIKESEARAQEANAKLAEMNVEKAKMEVDKAKWDRYENQLDHAAKANETLHKMLESNSDELRDKTTRIRELTDKLLLAEGLLNTANHKILRVTEERDRYRLLYERHKEYLCTSSTCCKDKPDPKGRRPPNPRILGKKFPMSEIAELLPTPDEKIIPAVKKEQGKEAQDCEKCSGDTSQ